MKHVKRITVLATAVAVVGCDSLTFPGSGCTTNLLWGINITVIDSMTGGGLLPGSTIRVRDGAFVDSLVFADTTNSQSAPSSVGLAAERAGTYVVSVSRAGYGDWTASNVRVTSDRCHVRTVTLLARLVPVR